MDSIVIARAPVHINLSGDTYHALDPKACSGQMMISAAIGYYVYTIINRNPLREIQIVTAGQDGPIRSAWPKDTQADPPTTLPEAIVNHFNIQEGLTIFLAFQIPTGAGLGACGSLAVSMVKSLAFCSGLDLDKKDVAGLACYLKDEHLDLAIGRLEDPYAAAYGGLNRITFSRDKVVVTPLKIPEGTHAVLERRLLLFQVRAPQSVDAVSPISNPQPPAMDRLTQRRLQIMNELNVGLQSTLEEGNLPEFARMLHRAWIEDLEFNEGHDNGTLNRCYQLARELGALGGRSTHAANRSFLLLYCPEEYQGKVVQALRAHGLQQWPFRLDTTGVQVMTVVPWLHPRLATLNPGMA